MVAIVVPTTMAIRVTLDGEPCSHAIGLQLNWEIPKTEDLRVRGTLVCRKLWDAGRRPVGAPLAELPLKRVTIPVWVRGYRTTGAANERFEADLVSDGEAVVTAEEA